MCKFVLLALYSFNLFLVKYFSFTATFFKINSLCSFLSLLEPYLTHLLYLLK
nr:MAG TPA: hypothetical protein [Caudoviricetes sp.]